MNNEADFKAWVRSQMDAAVKLFEEQGVFDDALMESKPAWAFPEQLVVGKARAFNTPQSFRWFVCGEVGFDHVDDQVAANPREALRHFAMKWQVDASRLTNTQDAEQRQKLISNAEFLYELSDDDRLWSAN